MKPLSERQIEFKRRVWQDIGETFDKYPKEMILSFCEYWFEMSYMGKKMRFEKERTFGITRRLATWKSNSANWNKSVEKKETLPNYFNKKLWQRIDHDRLTEYKEHLFNLGWSYQSSPGGTFWRDPKGKLIWL